MQLEILKVSMLHQEQQVNMNMITGDVIHTETGDQSADYVYDNVGNMIQYSTAGGTQVHKYDYDVLNRITKYTDALGNSESYT